MTTLIGCGQCHEKHLSVAAVRSCHETARASVLSSRTYVPTLDVSEYESDAGRCGRCAGTGQFITYVENNVPKGPGGICFRCAGKGRQVSCGTGRHTYVPKSTACCDITRNASYDTWGIRIYM